MASCTLVKKKCVICNNLFSSPVYSRHYSWCKKQDDFMKKYSLTAQDLTTEYLNLGSVLSFKDKYPFFPNFYYYYKLFKKYSIKVSLKQASNNPKTIQKREKTNLEKHGFRHNFCREHPSRKKWEQDLIINEGITNVFQRESVKIQIAKTIVEKYGEENLQVDRCRQRHLSRGAGTFTKITRKVCDILLEENIPFSVEKKLPSIKPNSKQYYYAYDIYLKDTNKLIEVNGDYWHGNPLIYKETDIILKGSSKEITVKQKWLKDSKKLKCAVDNGFNILIVWELDLNTEFEKTKEKILSYAKS